jgi:hypothetical protein
MAAAPEEIRRHWRNLMLISTVFILYVATATTVQDINRRILNPKSGHRAIF